MGFFKRTTASLDAGDSTTITGPAGTSGLNKIYVSSTNLTYAVVQTGQGSNELPKSANTNYQEGFFPLQQSGNTVTVTAFGMSSAETVTILTEWV